MPRKAARHSARPLSEMAGFNEAGAVMPRKEPVADALHTIAEGLQ